MGTDNIRTIAQGETGSRDLLFSQLKALARLYFKASMGISDAACSPVLTSSLKRWGVGESDTEYIKMIISHSSSVIEQLGETTLTNLRLTLSENPNLLQEHEEIGLRGVDILKYIIPKW